MPLAFLLVICLLLVDSLHFVFARLLLPHLPPGTSALYVLAVATVETGLYLGWRGNLRLALLRQHLPFFLSIGFLVAGSTAINYTAVAYLDPGTASRLAQTSILFALLFGLFWLQEKLRPAQLAGSGLAIIGVFVISFQPGDFLRFGALLVLGAAFMYALHAAIVKRYGGEIDFANFFFFRVACTTGFLLLFASLRDKLVWPGWAAWPYLLLAGSVDVTLSRTLYYRSLRLLPISFHATVLTVSPVITILWSLALFGERPSRQAFIGGAAVLLGVLIVTLQRTPTPRPPNNDAAPHARL